MKTWPISTKHNVTAVNFTFMTPENWDDALSDALRQCAETTEKVALNPNPASFANTLEELERSNVVLSDVFGALLCAKSHATEEIQDLVNKWSPIVTEAMAEMMQNETVYARVENAFANEGHLWNKAQTKLHADTLWALKEAGCGFDQKTKKRIKELKTDLSRLETQFEEMNLSNANTTLAIRSKDLMEAPEFLLDECAHQVIDGVDHICVPVNSAYAEPLLEVVSSSNVREKIWRAWTTRGYGLLEGDQDTEQVNQSILEKRSELSSLLGYNNWAEYMMAQRMETNPVKILTMLENIWEPLNAAAKDDLNALEKWAQNNSVLSKLNAWDVPYVLALRERETNAVLQGFDLKDYLPLPVVRQAAFDSAERVFGVRFEEDVTIPTYHPDVKPYIVYQGAEKIGVLLIDDYGRPSKEPGAWMNVYATTHGLDQGNGAGVINVLNVPLPPAGSSALLTYDEMVTIFHELGHALHGLLGKTLYPSQSGTNVSRDFVELPSQLFENWGTSADCFLKMARHHKTQEPIPENIYALIEQKRFFDQRFQKMSYMQSAFVDLKIHMMQYDGQKVRELEKEVLSLLNAPSSLVPRHHASHFSHVFGGGYAAGYYSYIWAEILEADIASRFEKNFFNPSSDICEKVQQLYQTGGSLSAIETFENFQGREPSSDALLERLGLPIPQKVQKTFAF